MSSLPTLPTERRITDKVQLIAPLAVGGMSHVFLAHHEGLATEVVVKLIDPARLHGHPGARERFIQEARIASRLASPHVVRVFDVGMTDDSVPFIVMEHLRGETLATRLAKGPLALGEVVAIVEQVASALVEAHALGIVHRDVKPANIFLVETSRGAFAKVLDFGVAKLTESDDVMPTTQAGALMGTPAYMAPEQLADASDVDHRSDLWSLAVVAYEALLGRRPFRGSNLGALSLSICSGCFELPSAHGLSKRLDDWFRRGLAVTVDERFAEASELAQALVEACQPAAKDSEGQSWRAPLARPRPASADLGGRELDTTVDARAPSRATSARWWPLVALGLAVVAVSYGLRPPPLAPARTFVMNDEPPPATRTPPVRDTDEPTGEEAPPVGARADDAPPSGAEVRPAGQRLPTRVEARAASAEQEKAARPAYCATDEAYVTDERGVLRPRPECL